VSRRGTALEVRRRKGELPTERSARSADKLIKLRTSFYPMPNKEK